MKKQKIILLGLYAYMGLILLVSLFLKIEKKLAYKPKLLSIHSVPPTINKVPQKVILQQKDRKDISLHTLLSNAKNNENYEAVGNKYFWYFKTLALTPGRKNAIYFNFKGDSLYTVEELFMNRKAYDIRLFEWMDNEWKLISQLDTFSLFSLSFSINIQDYDFDGVNDIFIIKVVSCGQGAQYGELLTIDPKNNKMILHPEIDGIENLSPDSINKVVLSEEVIMCDAEWNRCKKTLAWRNNKLVQLKRDCPCVPDK